ncbi:MAG: hypothetical protein HN889_06020 [Rhodospirillaceae bacterium]|jgi:hypothetical protein|nr:hypothetical protein [Rhodospirillaceae bacterium]MBT5562995.1 hypothetical protein [Rhodospirillaceae bacterium]MBT6242669.1 hypothetical protein [Rhodospirillaceae bacterium]MBT7137400.1 hypothetical protein [Rhodospirillaceae bacterium]
MNTADPTPIMAHQIPRGHCVRRAGSQQAETVFVKAERQGTEYIHHYLIQVIPRLPEGLAMIYVDPEEMLIDCGNPPTFDYADGETRNDPAIGDIFENPKGTYLKVIEDPKSQKMFAFIDTTSGEVKRRQERGVITVYPAWRIR